ncbi:MAG: NAD(P)H-binding protein [Bifidobacteriaceae bacterium]|jgi:uncharacterized protein YbjT (DUF2867 family)|nr:NAD(P)H-binding protein [Bifidobacteriaceae bacterium]MCI1978668.1 NAD(P)H-binding protein [Bifidobacteriaceae bacterium]
MNLLILAANGQIARIVENRVLEEPEFASVSLTLGLRNPQRLAELKDNARVRLVGVDLEDAASVDAVMEGQDMVFVAVVDHDSDNAITRNVVAAMKKHGVSRIISTNILGIYDEVPGEFGRWNKQMVRSGLQSAINSDALLKESGLDYTTLRLPWLNDRDEIKYAVTHRDEEYVGVSGSRKSIADVVVKIVRDPSFGSRDSLGIADIDTQGETRPVY